MPEGDEAEPRLSVIDALMALSRVMTAVVARTLADAAEAVSVPQLRILVMLYFHSPTNLTTIAQELGVDRSNASRPADRLVKTGLVRREDDETDRRNAMLTLTARGRRLVDSIMDRRQQIFDELLAEMSPGDRDRLLVGVTALLDAAKHGESAALAAVASESILPWIR